jgi:hypothetical protein
MRIKFGTWLVTLLFRLYASGNSRYHSSVTFSLRVVPQEGGLVTYFEDTWVCERERRTSVEKEIRIDESEMYRSMRPTENPPLLYGKFLLENGRCLLWQYLEKSVSAASQRAHFD